MFKKRKRELTTEDAPDSIAPWEMLHEEEVRDERRSSEERRDRNGGGVAGGTDG